LASRPVAGEELESERLKGNRRLLPTVWPA
jgi:hypothetical protein